LQAQLYELESYKKNKTIYNKIINKISDAINEYIKIILKNKILKLEIKENLSVFFDGHKIASLYKGEKILNPKLIIANNQYIEKENYNLFKKKIQDNLSLIIKEAFKEQTLNIKTNNTNLKAIIFTLKENLGIVKISEIEYFYKSLKPSDFDVLKENNIKISNNFIYYNLSTFNENNKAISGLY